MKDITVITKSGNETKKIAEILAKECLKTKPAKNALVLALEGDLGAGKTTFTQGFAKGLGIKEKIISPTFVLLKRFKINPPHLDVKRPSYGYLIHIDAYRLEEPEELEVLGWGELWRDAVNIIIVEWADRIKRILPKNYIEIKFKHKKDNEREIIISEKVKTKK